MWTKIHADYWENDSLDLIHHISLDDEDIFYCHVHGSTMLHDGEGATLEEAIAAFEFITPPIVV